MRIHLVTPAPAGSQVGNRVTAHRWAELLRSLGHDVALANDYAEQPCDLLIALHARKSHPAIMRFSQHRPYSPLIVGISGTDLYEDLPHSAEARLSLELTSRLVLLQAKAIERLPEHIRDKARVICQSAVVPLGPYPTCPQFFDVCVMGHMRPVKDSLRTAHAARLLPAASRIRVIQIGKALTQEAAAETKEEIAINPRFYWRGEMPQQEALRTLGGCRLLSLTSLSEGGANVISEAVMLGVPIVSTRIDGSVGLLGDEYPGYFDVGDTQALARLLHRCETDQTFLQSLTDACQLRQPLFSPEHERAGWANLLAEIEPQA